MLGLHPKVQNAAFAGAVVVVLVWVIGMFGVTVPPMVSAAFSTIVMSITGYATEGNDKP